MNINALLISLDAYLESRFQCFFGIGGMGVCFEEVFKTTD